MKESRNNPAQIIKDFFRGRWDLLLLLYIPVFLVGFFLVERMVPDGAESFVSYCRLDDLIPFNEKFVIFYAMWVPLIFVVGIYLMLFDIQGFKKYMYFFITGLTACLVFCVLVPNGQHLRPTVFPRQNFCTDMVRLIYKNDTYTNVFPSMHVYGAVGAALGLAETDTIRGKWRWLKLLTVFLAVMISISTCFIKQHSILDVVGGLILSVIVYAIFCIIIREKSNIS